MWCREAMPQLVQAYSRNDLRLLLKENQISYHKKVRALSSTSV